MPSRTMLAAILAGAAFLPYLVSSNSPVREQLSAPLSLFGKSADDKHDNKAASAGLSAAHEATPHDPHAAPLKPGTTQAAVSKPRTAAGPPLVALEHVFRWETTPAWVLGTWPRVTTHLAELDLQGYRLALVSGTTETDIAGSLTYYFDAQQRLQRITFNGTTGDAHRLVVLLNREHRFQRRLTEDPSLFLYQVEQDQHALSELKIRSAPVVRAGNPLSRFEVSLEMRRPEA